MPRNSSVLVVEDDRAVRNLIATTLESSHYRFIVAENGRSAIMQAQTHRPDVILLDLGLPDMDGVQVITAIRQTMDRAHHRCKRAQRGPGQD